MSKFHLDPLLKEVDHHKDLLSIEIGNSFPNLQLKNQTCVDLILKNAKSNPNAVALRGPQDADGTYRELTYSDMVYNAKKLSDIIQAHFYGKDLRDKFIAILLPRDVDFVGKLDTDHHFGMHITFLYFLLTLYFNFHFRNLVSMLACYFCGAAYVPLADNLPAQRVGFILQDSEAVAVITCCDPKITNLLGDVSELLGGCAPHSIILDAFSSDMVWSSSARKNDEKVITKSSFRFLPGPRNLAYMIYTSGTTGNPKGVEVEHHSFLNVLLSHVQNGDVTNVDMSRSVCVAAFIFDSHVREVWMPLVWGGCNCIAKDVLHLTEGSMCAGTPTGLIAAADSNSFPPTIKTVMAGGEKLSKDVLMKVTTPSTNVNKMVNAYGPTETVVESLRPL